MCGKAIVYVDVIKLRGVREWAVDRRRTEVEVQCGLRESHLLELRRVQEGVEETDRPEEM